MDFSKEISFGKKKKEDPKNTPAPQAANNQQPENTDAPVQSGVKPVKPAASGLSKPIEIPFKAKKETYPSKTHINLITSDTKKVSTATEIILFAILVVLIAIFAKFAVVDPLASGFESSQRVANLQSQYNELKTINASKEGLSQEYSKYVIKDLTPEEQALTNRNDIIDLLRSKVMSVGSLTSLKVSGNEVTATCSDISLNEVSALVQVLENDERVSYVTVSTAQGTESKGTSATIAITMKNADEIVKQKQEGVNNG